MSRSRKSRQTQFQYSTSQLMDRQRYLRRSTSYLEGLVLSRIKWEGLPDTVDERFLETTLFQTGSCLFWDMADDDEEPLFIVSGYASRNNAYDVYGNPTEFSAQLWGKQVDVPIGEGVVIWDNLSRRVMGPTIWDYANDLAEMDISRNVNVKQQRWPIIVSGASSQANEIEQMKRDIEEGTPVIMRYDAASPTSTVGAVTTNLAPPFEASNIMSAKATLIAEIYQMLGIENVPRDKAQYMNYGETGINSDAVEIARSEALTPRMKAAEQINELYDLNISVHWRTDETKTTTPIPNITREDDGDE